MSRWRIFVPVVGQFENLGDVLLRRTLLVWLRELGCETHVYLGRARPDFVEGLELTDHEIRYSSFRKWYKALAMSAFTKPTIYFFKPGEIQLSLRGMREHIAVIPVAAILRLRQNPIIRIGSGVRRDSRFWRSVMWPSVLFCSFTAWRDVYSATIFKVGQIMPDLAFLGREYEFEEKHALRRTRIVLSLRGDEVRQLDALLGGLFELRDSYGLSFVVVSQVDFDNVFAQQLATTLGCDAVTYRGATPEEELTLRGIYRSAAVVVSDRLHVLIAAATEGAGVAGPIWDGDLKIGRHFKAAGYPDVTVNCHGMSSENICARLVELMEEDSYAHLAAAQERLRDVQKRIAQICA